VELRQARSVPARIPADHPQTDHADGDREPTVGLHADPRRSTQPRPSSGAKHDRKDPEGGGPRTGSEPADAVDDVPPRALGRGCGQRLPHGRGLDAVRAG
jgi:hypothetical protein